MGAAVTIFFTANAALDIMFGDRPMKRHPLDGSAIAADRHYAEQAMPDIRDGGPCPEEDCDGTLDVSEPDEDDPQPGVWCSVCGRIA